MEVPNALGVESPRLFNLLPGTLQCEFLANRRQHFFGSVTVTSENGATTCVL